MAVFGMTEEEKKKILGQHKGAVKSDTDKKAEIKKGLQQPEKKENKKAS